MLDMHKQIFKVAARNAQARAALQERGELDDKGTTCNGDTAVICGSSYLGSAFKRLPASYE
eukprot:4807381-Alexandrium_andersonii.AAC.1